MYGRYQFSFQSAEAGWIAEAVEAQYGPGAWAPGDIHPGDRAPVLLPGDGEKPKAALFTWGYPSRERPIINARAETAAEKPVFREGAIQTLRNPFHRLLRMGRAEAEVFVQGAAQRRGLHGGRVRGIHRKGLFLHPDHGGQLLGPGGASPDAAGADRGECVCMAEWRPHCPRFARKYAAGIDKGLPGGAVQSVVITAMRIVCCFLCLCAAIPDLTPQALSALYPPLTT